MRHMLDTERAPINDTGLTGLAVIAPATAAPSPLPMLSWSVTARGSIAFGTDELGLFGMDGADLGGRAYSHVITVDLDHGRHVWITDAVTIEGATVSLHGAGWCANERLPVAGALQVGFAGPGSTGAALLSLEAGITAVPGQKGAVVFRLEDATRRASAFEARTESVVANGDWPEHASLLLSLMVRCGGPLGMVRRSPRP